MVKIFSVDGAAGNAAKRRVELISADVEVGSMYEGKVARLMDFGAFVTIPPGRDGQVRLFHRRFGAARARRVLQIPELDIMF